MYSSSSSSSSSSNTIYVGNIQSINDKQLREYFQKFGQIEAFYHNCARASDEWLIDHRFIRFSSDTDMSVFLTNKIDHIICRIRLDIHPYQAVFSDQTRLISDRKICIAHTDTKLDRNVIKKSFTKYGRILNCVCVSSGNGVEYIYIEFESINSIRSVFASNRQHFAGRSSLAVKQPLRPSQVGAKIECIAINDKELRESSIGRSSQQQRINSNVDTAQYSSFLVSRHNSMIEEEELQRSISPITDQSVNVSSPSQRVLLSLSSNTQISNNNNNNNNLIRTNNESCSLQQLKDYEHDYELIIRQDFDRITYQIDKFLQNQKQSYKGIYKYILDELRSQCSSSSNEDGEIESISSLSSSNSKNSKYIQRKRHKSHH